MRSGEIKRIISCGMFFSLLINITHLSVLQANEPVEAISITFSGDILPHESLYRKAKTIDGYNFDFAFKNISPYLSGDINICHLETTLTAHKPTSYPSFSTPYQIASAIKNAGYQGCDVASNHILDKGFNGLNLTYQKLNEVGLVVAGVNPDSKEEGEASFLVNDIKVTLLAYTYGTNGIKDPVGHEGVVNRITASKILKDASHAKSKGADIVLIYLHWGKEYQEKPTSSQMELAEDLLASTAINAVVGSHVHVLQKAVAVNGKPLVYGMGNFWSGQGSWSGQPEGQFGEIIKLNFKRIAPQSFEYVNGTVTPTYVKSSDWSIYPALSSKQGYYQTVSCAALKKVKKLQGALLKTPPLCRP